MTVTYSRVPIVEPPAQVYCEHLVEDPTMHPHTCLAIGEHKDLMICPHCYEALRARFVADFFEGLMKGFLGETFK